MANSITINVRAKDQASSEIDKIKGKMSSLATSKGFKDITSGLAMGAGIAAWNMLGSAVAGAGQFLGDAAQAAMEDEASQAKLATALEANVKGWDGNRDAIEKVLAERMKLGFSDDEQRDSLALLVARTGDATEALDIQSAAMDLARLKGISLAEASKAIALGMSGQGRALKELGINVAEMTDKTQVLAAIQDKAGGQAEAFGNTTAGAMAKANVAIGEAAESIGYLLLPAIGAAANAITNMLTPTTEDVTIQMRQLDGSIKDVTVGFNPLLMGMKSNIDTSRTYAEILASETAASDRLTAQAKAQAVAMAQVSDATKLIKAPAYDAAAAFDEMRAAWKKLDDETKQSRTIRDLPDQITVAKDEAVKAHKELRSAIGSGDKVSIAAARLKYRAAKDNLHDLRTEWARLRAEIASNYIVGTFDRNGNSVGQDGRVRRAAGGPVMAGQSYVVGETKAERFVPWTNGTIVPTGGGGGGTAGSPVIIRLELDGRVLTDVIDKELYYRLATAPATTRAV